MTYVNKPNLALSTLSKAVALACLSLSSAPLLAAEACTGGTTTISTLQPSNTCALDTGKSLVVNVGGSLGGGGRTVRVFTTIGSITNSGSISGSAMGIALDTNKTLGGDITNNAGATISGGGTAGILLFNNGTIGGSVINSGSISANSGITMNKSRINGNIINGVGGTIQGVNGMGILVDLNSTVVGDITNSGTINGSSSPVSAGIFLQRNGTVQGNITNNAGGIISGAKYGINVWKTSTVTGGITNSGSISGNGTGINIQTSSTVGNITNTGTISGTTAAIDLNAFTGSAMTINNSGLLDGAVVLRDNILNLNGTAGRVSGLVTGTANSIVNINGSFITENNFTGITSFNVNNGGLLNIHNGGNITTTTLSNDGVLAVTAGNTATITGDYTQTANGLFRIGADSNANFGKLNVTGTASLTSNANIDVDVNAVNTLANSQILASVLSAGALISDGTFNVTDNSALFDFTGSKNGNSIDLTTVKTLTVVDAVTNSGSSAGTGAATIFDDLADNGGGTAAMGNVITALGQLATEQEVADAVESTLPGVSGGVSQLTNLATNAVVGVIAARQDLTRGLSSGDGMLTDRHFWLKPFGGKTDQDDRQGVTGYDIDSYGIAAGFDGDISANWNVGFAFAYINSDVESNLAVGSHNIDMDSYQVKVYATNMLDDVTALNLQAGIGKSDYDSKRRIFTGDVASADYDSWNIQLNVELERSYQVGVNTVLTPYVHADYSYVDVENYDETGAGALNLNVDDDSADSLVVGTGVKAIHNVSQGLLLMANAGIGYDVMTNKSSLTSSFSGGGANFTTEGIRPDKVVYNAGVGAKYSLANGTEITASYNIDGRQDYTDQSVSANFRFLF